MAYSTNDTDLIFWGKSKKQPAVSLPFFQTPTVPKIPIFKKQN